MKYFITFLLTFTFLPHHLVAQEGSDHSRHYHAAQKTAPAFWTCSMHPQIKLPEPGQCPICNMDLIPVESDPEGSASDSGNVTTLTLSPTAQKLASIETTPVVRKSVTKEIPLVGMVDYDETILTHITAWVPGRIERMFVDYKGITVKKGDHMLELYSPELLSAQEELIQAARSVSRLQSGSALVRKSTKQALVATREKLKLLGLTETQVKEIEHSRKARDQVTIYAPIGGIVVERNATEGMYVQTGTRIYSIADLSKLWIYLDAYESDLPWIRYGQQVEFSTKAIPGKTFTGKISFISPVVDESTRTTKIRVSVDNTKGLLKPGLYVDAVVRADIYGPGKVMDASLEGKYIGPMHPEIVKDSAGTCPICGMDLVPAEELGYLTHPEDVEEPLVIPETAPLLTGTRAVVYVKAPKKTRFELREIVLGPRAGKYYIVESGLQEKELVVTKGAFKIDADLQIRGKQSMMNPEGQRQSPSHDHGAMAQIKDEETEGKTSRSATLSQESLATVQYYLDLSEALAADNLEASNEAFSKLVQNGKQSAFQELIPIVKETSPPFDSLEAAREPFYPITNALLSALKGVTLPDDLTAFIAYCPMALQGKGASWIQRGKEVRNPYYGAYMLACGSIEEEL